MTKNDSTFTMVLPSDLKKQVEKKAQSKGLSIASYIRLVLSENVEN